MLAGCSGLTSVTLSEGMSSIPELTLYGCSSLSGVNIPASVSSIGSQAFGNCSGMSSITVPASVSSMDMSAFSGCSNLAEINVESGNGTYASHDGAVYNASLTQLVYCPIGKSSLELSPSITTIGAAAFQDCPYVYDLTIPDDSVTTIEADAFTGSGIGSVRIPKSVTSIGSQSSWTPDVIYGYRGSQAEQFADDNGYIFSPLDGGNDDPDPGTDDPDPGTDDPDPGKDDPDPGTKDPKPGDDDPDPGTKDPTKPGNNGTGSSTNTGTGTNGTGGTAQTGTGGTRSATSASRSVGTAKVGSATPKTGVPFDARYLLCAGVFLTGAYLVISKKKVGAGKNQ